MDAAREPLFGRDEAFVTTGAVPTTSAAYVAREFEDAAFNHITAGDWVTLLGPRQHGKTSGLIRLRERFVSEGIAVALLDLHGFGDKKADLRQLLGWMTAQVRAQLGLSSTDFASHQQVSDALADMLTGGPPGEVLIMIDEAVHLEPETSRQFFSQLRALHTAQRSGMASEPASRVLFLFAGTFRPDTVIDDDNSPFNVSRLVETEDLTEAQIEGLCLAVTGTGSGDWASRIYAEVGGQPYLVQIVLDSVMAAADGTRDDAFALALRRISAGADGHLPSLLRRLSREPGAEELLTRVVQASPHGLPTGGDGLCTFLTTVGAARLSDDLRLFPRNQLYGRAFLASPTFNPDAFLRPGGPAETGVESIIGPLSPADLSWIVDEHLRMVILDNHSGAIVAAERRQYRLAVAGLGSAYEGILLAFVEQMDQGEREDIRRTVILANGQTPPRTVARCTFEGLIEIAHKTGTLSRFPLNASSVARDWRNSVHPDKARRHFEDQKDLMPEVQILAALISKLVRAVGVP